MVESAFSFPALAVIPARGGSKRIPRKNIRHFRGRPMIAWSIGVAKASGLFEHVVVSTDDAEIAEVATAWGAEVPFVRPADLSTDYIGTTDVVAHATQHCQERGWPMEAVCCIYATAPFVRVEDLKRSRDVLAGGDWAYAITVTEFATPIFRSFRQNADGGLEMFFPEHFTSRSQDLPIALHDAAQFYWGRPQAWLNKARVFDKSTIGIRIPRWRVQDIDTEEDWLRAEAMAAYMNAHHDQ
jgi:N-acylneuraminate cytidylyltransferase